MKWLSVVCASVTLACCFAQCADAKDAIKTRTKSSGFVQAAASPQFQSSANYQTAIPPTPQVDLAVNAPPSPVFQREYMPTPTQQANATFTRSRTRTNFGPPQISGFNWNSPAFNKNLQSAESTAQCQCGCNQLNCACGKTSQYAAATSYGGPRAYTQGISAREHLQRHHGYAAASLSRMTPQEMENAHSYEHRNDTVTVTRSRSR